MRNEIRGSTALKIKFPLHHARIVLGDTIYPEEPHIEKWYIKTLRYIITFLVFIITFVIMLLISFGILWLSVGLYRPLSLLIALITGTIVAAITIYMSTTIPALIKDMFNNIFYKNKQKE